MSKNYSKIKLRSTELINDTENVINSRKQPGDIYLAVVMPAYNEALKIKDNLLEASRIISGFVKKYEIIVVNDGSKDNTDEQINLAASQDSHIRVISYGENHGKGYAVKVGVEAANSEFIAFLDSDLELNPSMLKRFLKGLKEADADIAIGSKLHKDSKLDYPLRRKIMSFGYYLILKFLFKLKIKDTQTGIKLFKADVIKPICEDIVTDGFAFDIEILATANSKGYKIIEMTIELVYDRPRKAKSRFTLKIIAKVFSDTIAIRKKLSKKGR